MAELQSDLILEAAGRLRLGGMIVYSTWTLALAGDPEALDRLREQGVLPQAAK